MKRLQGDEWHQIKYDVEILGYFENKGNGRIKVFTRLLAGPILYHWLNDLERSRFEKHKHKYPIMNDKAEVVK